MKQILSLILAISLVLCLFPGCTGNPPETSVPTTAPEVSTTAPPTESTTPVETVDPVIQTLRENLPVMDGSTSLIPLEAGIRSALFDISIEEATKDVLHTSSWNSFYNLLNGTAHMVFSVPLSEEQLAIAAEQGVALETYPIAMEGFVFAVNAENPVDTLTQQQLRDIYSGKITNWSEVGGLDEEIIPYQRNRDSGSQNYMLTFMGDTPLMDAPIERRPASMGGLMDAIAVNDNSRAAIGYSVYAYAADMYGNGNEIKFIKVDGVAPSKATFADGTYPLMGYNYVIFRADEPEGSYVRKLVDWILSDDGQLAIAKAGYVTVRDIGYDYTEDTIEKYEGTGLGPAATEVPSSEYVIQTTTHHVESWGEYDTYSNNPSLTETTTPEGYRTWHISQLTDKALEAEINDWIDSQMIWLNAEMDNMRQLVENLNKNYNYSRYVIKEGPHYINPSPPCIVTLRNGYLSVAVALRYWEGGMVEHYLYYHTETATWDLLTGQMLTPEELFCQDIDIDGMLNTYLREYTQMPRREFQDPPAMIQDFAFLPESGWHLTIDGLYIDHDNPDFLHGEFIPLDWMADGVLVADQARDFASCIDDPNTRVMRRYRVSDRDLRYAYNADQSIMFTLLDEDTHPNAAKINAEVTDFLNTHYTEAPILAYFDGLGIPQEDLNLWYRDWYLENLGGIYLFFQGTAPEAMNADGEWVTYPQPQEFIYDLRTGEQIHWTDLLQGDWLSHSVLYNVISTEITLDPASYQGMDLLWVRYEEHDNTLLVCLKDESGSWYLTIPGEYFRF